MNPQGKSKFIVVREDGTIRKLITKSIVDGEMIPENWIEITDSIEKSYLTPENIDFYIYTEDPDIPVDTIKPFPEIFTITSKKLKVVESPAVPFDPDLLWGAIKPSFGQTESYIDPNAYTKKYTKSSPIIPLDGVERKIYKKPRFNILVDKTTVVGDGVDTITVTVSDVPSGYSKVNLKVGSVKFNITPIDSSVQLTFDTPQDTQIESDETRLVATPVKIKVT